MKETKIGHNASVTLDTTGLDALVLAGKERYVVRVGIMGSKAQTNHQRKETGELKPSGGHKTGKETSDMTNAEIGLAHEKGIKSKGLPRRSWLVNPLEDHLPEYFSKIGEEAIHILITQGIQKNYEQLGIICEQIIQKGFQTGGYGKWKPLSARTIAGKNSSSILIDTGQLRKSITHEVVAV